MTHFPKRPLPLAAGISLVAALALVGGCHDDDDDDVAAAPEIRTLSNRADLVSGGDVLVEIVPAGGDLTGLHVEAGGRDVTAAFARRADGRVIGLVTGLDNGDNVLTA